MDPACEPEGAIFHGLSHYAIYSQLETILTSDTFSHSERVSAFLGFVVGESLAGRSGGLKESLLLEELYGGRARKNEDDAIVRVDARRVRDKLREFYSFHQREPVIITLPKGGYVPRFESNPGLAEPQVHDAVSITPASSPAGPRHWSRSKLAFYLAAVSIAVLGSLAWWRMSRPYPPLRLIAITNYAGEELHPALSPDGNLVAFSWSGPDAPAGTRAQTDVWVKAIDSEALRRLTATPAFEGNPSWSPDGKWIAFDRGGAGVFLASQSGGAERRISSGIFPRFTPDGRYVLVRDVSRPQSPGCVFEVDLTTLERRQITRAPAGDGDFKFEVSPNGKSLAFIRYERTGMGDVYTVPLIGGEPKRLTDRAAPINELAWMPNGRELVFSVLGESLWRIDAASSRPGRGEPVSVPSPMFPAFSISLSRLRPGGAVRLAFASKSEDISLQMVGLRTTRPDGSLESRPLLDATRIDVPAAFSPDGQTIAFHGIAVGLPWRLFLSQKDGSGLRALTLLDRPPNANPKFGSWSPDGKKIVFDGLADGNSDIYLMSVDGGAPVRLTADAATDFQPSWSRDGLWIYYSSNRTGRHEIWRLPANGGSATQITRRGGAEPRESLDGRHVLFLSGVPIGLNGLRSPGELRRIAVHGGEEQTILPRVGLGLWGITERGILYAAEEPGRDIINLYDTRDRRVSRIGHLTFRIPRMNAVARIAFSPDGLLALSNRMDRAEADVMMIENFR